MNIARLVKNIKLAIVEKDGKESNMTDVPVKVDNLEKTFRKSLGFSSFKAVDSLSFQVNNGEILGFLGPNGAGKTTTIKCILGLLKPTSGNVLLWNDFPASGSVRMRIGYVPENPDYEDIFTPLEFMTMFSSMRKLDISKDQMISILGRVGLEEWVNVRIRNFSKGMKQRMSLSLALQSKPELLIMDEPTGGLDPAARKEFRDVILEENSRGATIFLSSHLLSEVETICDRAVILAKGKKVTEGNLDDLLRTEDMFSISFTVHGAETDMPENKKVTSADLQKTIDELRKNGQNILEVKPVYRSLEEVFLSATSGGKL